MVLTGLNSAMSPFAFSHTGVGEGLDSTVADPHTGEGERHFDDEFENVGEGKESEISVGGNEQFVEQSPNGTD